MTKRVYRLTAEKKIGGVCAGLAEYFSIDPTLVRIFFIFLIFLNGVGIGAYILLWILLPQKFPPLYGEKLLESQNDFATTKEIEPFSRNNSSATIVLGFAFLAVAALMFLGDIIPEYDFFDAAPLFLSCAGIVLIWTSLQKKSL